MLYIVNFLKIYLHNLKIMIFMTFCWSLGSRFFKSPLSALRLSIPGSHASVVAYTDVLLLKPDGREDATMDGSICRPQVRIP